MSDFAATALLERLSRVIHNDAHASGLKPTQWEALRFLARANRVSRSPGALTGFLGVTKGTVSQTLQALERKGLIEKTTADGDRRGVKLDLTPAGRTLLADDPLTDLDASLAAMPPEARDQLSTSLERLMTEMLARRGGRAFGACRTCRHFTRGHREGAPYFCALLRAPLSREESEQICIEQETTA
ncbi:transcriptional regulator [Marinicauda pacifica]|jgi:DNA-binding MarR family transcriptional regulator|uniref:MarR family transcriptional regulator n=1 Tax=Marinicauda pacifica TaxID=1133559 RepID=A0A4S2HA73_9PROT|nr:MULTISPECIES: MarR family transcriptional regulator [Marinicauda]TGY92814.1 MarR family transcriptional regulator [Marinicauda pacifica]GGE40559.1 transcriptional regulator [Marinicauda pacifica]